MKIRLELFLEWSISDILEGIEFWRTLKSMDFSMDISILIWNYYNVEDMHECTNLNN